MGSSCSRIRNNTIGIAVALTQGGEGDVCCMLDHLVQLDADDSRSPRLYQAEGNIMLTSHLS
jgi:hypothetical protein